MLLDAWQGSLGGQSFVDRIRQEMKSPRFPDEVPRAPTLKAVGLGAVFAAVGQYYGVDEAIFAVRGNPPIARAAAAWLSRRLTMATLRELLVPLGLSRPESVSNLPRHMERQLAKEPNMQRDRAKIEARIARETKNKV